MLSASSIENCKKDDDINEKDFDEFYELMRSEKGEQGKYEIIGKIDDELIRIDNLLNRKVLCERCKEKKGDFN